MKRVFHKLMGNPPGDNDATTTGAQELGQITFQGVDPPKENGDDDGCDRPGTRMYTDKSETDRPITVVCEDAWYLHASWNTTIRQES